MSYNYFVAIRRYPNGKSVEFIEREDQVLTAIDAMAQANLLAKVAGIEFTGPWELEGIDGGTRELTDGSRIIVRRADFEREDVTYVERWSVENRTDLQGDDLIDHMPAGRTVVTRHIGYNQVTGAHIVLHGRQRITLKHVPDFWAEDYSALVRVRAERAVQRAAQSRALVWVSLAKPVSLVKAA